MILVYIFGTLVLVYVLASIPRKQFPPVTLEYICHCGNQLRIHLDESKPTQKITPLRGVYLCEDKVLPGYGKRAMHGIDIRCDRCTGIHDLMPVDKSRTHLGVWKIAFYGPPQ